MTFVERANISDAWRDAVTHLSKPGCDELVPLIVKFGGVSTAAIVETPQIRSAVDAHLKSNDKLQAVDTVASTIFPVSMWNRAQPRAALFERYKRVLPRLHAASVKNRRGLYFERMINGGPPGAENQLDFALDLFSKRDGVRRSALQIATFQPNVDHSGSARLGFPCLQHVLFTPVGDTELHVCAFYATQYMVERAYGNYLGLARLGQFFAHELNRELASVTCVAGLAVLDASKKALRSVLAACGSAPTTE